jgi:hypothetical protein
MAEKIVWKRQDFAAGFTGGWISGGVGPTGLVWEAVVLNQGGGWQATILIGGQVFAQAGSGMDRYAEDVKQKVEVIIQENT